MNVKQLLGAVTGMIIKIAIAAVVIIFVFKAAVSVYDFGFQLFADIPVSEGEGRTVSVTISEMQDSGDVGKLLEEKGIIRDATAFIILAKLSESEDEIQPGSYELSTSMSMEEILEVLCETEDTTEVEN